LIGEELNDHVLVNNCRARHRLRLRRWQAGANGFLLRSDEIGTSEGQGNRTFIIIFCLPAFGGAPVFAVCWVWDYERNVFWIDRNVSSET